MFRVIGFFFLLFGLAIFGSSCSSNHQIQNVGMLLEEELDEQPWDQKGLKGLKNIKEKYDVKYFIKENVKTENDVIKAVEELEHQGVNLIFGHNNIYGQHFGEIADEFPDIHFVYFNGDISTDNVTSLNFDSHAMGFFGGMIASQMTETGSVGIIAAYEWQPELEGFFEGIKYENPNIQVHMNFINDWNGKDVVFEMYHMMRQQNIDVIYPTGDSFSGDIIKQASNDHIYAIGYVEDQSYIDQKTVLTSTIQHVDKLYEYAADKFNKNKLEGGIFKFDFQEEAISLGPFSPDVPTSYQQFLEETLETYIETGLLPHQSEE